MENKIYKYLSDVGCCRACCLRYLPDNNIEFNNIDEYIKKKQLYDLDDPQVKKLKSNPCTICLGLLQDSVLEDIVNHVLLSEAQQYDTEVFTCSVSIPAAVLIREQAVRIDVIDRYFEKEEDIDFPLSKAWKLIIKNKLSHKLGLKFENFDVCNFSINVIMDYVDNDQELEVIKKIMPRGSKNIKLFSRKAVSDILLTCTPEKFKEFVCIPPKVPTSYLICKHIDCKHNSIYLAGRYCKYSRQLSQSPWIIDGVKSMETSIEEIIFKPIQKLLGVFVDSLKLSSSGREDCDVRCLGKGRPFYIEIINPKKTHCSFTEFRELESKINQSSVISVRDLQIVPRSDLVKIKEGEEMKTKDYVAICCTKDVIDQEVINKINGYGQVVLEQKTPIRVLHRRPLALRRKTVYKMVAELIPKRSRYFKLSLVTEAGTYVKEFVHGDFGRTKPSLGDIIGINVDIVALDVIAINLDWPKQIDPTLS